MTSDPTSAPTSAPSPSVPSAVYRLLAGTRSLRTLRLGDSLIDLKRRQFQGPQVALQDSFEAEWTGDPKARKVDFASDYPGAPMLSRGLVDRVGQERLERAGRLVPVRTPGPEPDDYALYVVEPLVDCVDTRRSAQPKKATGEMRKTIFRPEAVPAELPAFRVPQFPVGVCWTGWMRDLLDEILGGDLEARLLWSPEPSAAPHPDPRGL
ncbi:hypothetical protein [Streptomyces hyaluromycini]|uniref:hypothetical protein n=1 Tax=Streptomyces hyaluromycini TaxID=1377993 RepID=UPI000B5CE56E|nr:hypothetical protein [Streptomyces hyaluromycini]